MLNEVHGTKANIYLSCSKKRSNSRKYQSDFTQLQSKTSLPQSLLKNTHQLFAASIYQKLWMTHNSQMPYFASIAYIIFSFVQTNHKKLVRLGRSQAKIFRMFFRPVTRVAGGRSPPCKLRPLEECVGHSLKLWTLLKKFWPLAKNSSPHLLS